MPTRTSTTTTTAQAAPDASKALRDAAGARLRQMRKGTKSCQECRRRKIKCNYPPTPLSSPSSTTSPDKPHKCIECTAHDRQCLIQGYVAGPVPTVSSTISAPSDSTARQTRIYKRRREMLLSSNSAEPSPPHVLDTFEDRDDDDYDDYDDSAPRVKIRVDRIDSVVERIAREQRLKTATRDPALGVSSTDAKAGNLRPSFLSDGLDSSSTFETFRDTRFSDTNWPTSLTLDRSGIGFPTTVPIEEQTKDASPVLSQLFNNEIFSQQIGSPEILMQKVQVMTFSDNNKDATDIEKLSSTISSEPYLLKVLDISVHWWISWRDQSFALHDVFLSQTEVPNLPPASGWCPSSRSASVSSTVEAESRMKTNHTGAAARRAAVPVSLRDFVQFKLSHDNAIAISTALLCIAMSLLQLRPGIDDIELNISTTPAELAERIVLAVDTIVLSPSSNPGYMRDPGVLLVLMMRSKVFSESSQLRKSWLLVRKAIEAARDMGFAEPQIPPAQDQDNLNLGEEELTRLFHRQRFIGSIMELERLLSMVLGFPHSEDIKFTDRLAMAVLRDQSVADESAPKVSIDVKMRALRRVVCIAAGHVNDRNACSNSDDVKLRMTNTIQESLNEAAAAMPASWWMVESHVQYDDPYVAYEHLVAQLWFWQVQTFLHLPFMLKPNPNLRSRDHNDYDAANEAPDPYESNRFLCLQGCRRMLHIFYLLRSDPSLSVYICTCEDFQGVFCACILMVGLILRLSFCPHTLPPPKPELVGNTGEDIALLEDIKDIFRYRAQQQGGCISKQGLKVLEELGLYLDGQDDMLYHGKHRRRTVVLPYFGAIHLELRSPRHLRENGRLPESQSVGEMPPLTPASWAEGFIEAASKSTHAEPAAQIAMPEWDADADDPSFEFPLPDGNLDWDQFLFGDELGRDWEAELPDWPVEESVWEW